MVTTFRENTPILARYQPHAAFFFSHATGAGALAGAVSFAVSSFFGYGCVYPATVTAICVSAYASAALSQTPQQVVWNQKFRGELLSSLARTVRKYLDNVPVPLQENIQSPNNQQIAESNQNSSVPNNQEVTPLRAIALDNALEWEEVNRWPPVTYNGQFVAVRAVTNGTGLKYVAINLQTQATQLGDIQIDDSIKKTIEFLKNCFVTLEPDGSPVFSLSYHSFAGMYKSQTLRAELLLRQKDCIWNIYDVTSQTITCINLFGEFDLSWRCSSATVDFARRSFSLDRFDSIRHQIQCAREFVLYQISPYRLELEPIHQSSGFGEHMLISKFMYAITLIRYKGISGNHAQMIIEGINDGFIQEVPIGHYFVCLADLLGAKKIKQGNGVETEVRAIRTSVKNKFDLKYEARSETWKRSSSSVKSMIQAIVEERDNPPPGFAIYGRHSMFASKEVVEDSCITWAISKLSLIDIFLKGEKSPIFYTDTSDFARFKPGQKAPSTVTLDPYASHPTLREISQLPCSL